jgi:hypothetical protein
LLGISLMVIMIGDDAPDAATRAFERAARSVLGPQTSVLVRQVEVDPADAESAAFGAELDGVVELSWSEDHSGARLHCYLSREQRWVDREIEFGIGHDGSERELHERGRLLGFAVATMFTEEGTSAEPAAAPVVEPAPAPATVPRVALSPSAPRPPSARERTLEFAGIVSSGVDGTAAGLGAMAGVRVALVGPLSLRGFVAGRAGNIPQAQASTRTGQLGAGLSLAVLPPTSPWDVGVRADGMCSYFEASHLSEDDAESDRRQRWLGGADLIAEGGFRLTGGAGLYFGSGIEVMFGKTEVFTHGARVAVVPPLRAVAELGFRTRF